MYRLQSNRRLCRFLQEIQRNRRCICNRRRIYGESTESIYKDSRSNCRYQWSESCNKNADGTYSFAARKTGSNSGIKNEAQKTVDETKIVKTVRSADDAETYGAFIRVDLTGDAYGDLGANMQTVRWDYYGNDSTYTNKLATYGTKFAADNWMHKSMGVQLD